jgi:hypothetical protein
VFSVACHGRSPLNRPLSRHAPAHRGSGRFLAPEDQLECCELLQAQHAADQRFRDLIAGAIRQPIAGALESLAEPGERGLATRPDQRRSLEHGGANERSAEAITQPIQGHGRIIGIVVAERESVITLGLLQWRLLGAGGVISKIAQEVFSHPVAISTIVPPTAQKIGF